MLSLFDGILLLFAISGLVFIFVYASIMDKIGLRQLWEKSQFLTELFHCSACAGVWLSVYGLFCIYLKLNYDAFWFYLMTFPFAASNVSYIIDRFTSAMDAIINNKK